MPDISGLSGLAPVEQLDLAQYADNRKSTFRLPPAGTYLMRAPESYPAEAFGVSKAGALTVQTNPTIAEGPFEGFDIRYQSVSAKPYQRKGQLVSQLGDYLRAFGFRGVLKTPQDLADAVDSTAGRTYYARVNWRAYDKATGQETVGMEKFPLLEDGTHQSWIESPAKDPETGKPIRVRASLTVTDYLPAEV